MGIPADMGMQAKIHYTSELPEPMYGMYSRYSRNGRYKRYYRYVHCKACITYMAGGGGTMGNDRLHIK